MQHHSLGCRRCKKGVCRYEIFSPFCHRCHSGRVFLDRPPTFWGHCNCRKTANLAVRSIASQGGPSLHLWGWPPLGRSGPLSPEPVGLLGLCSTHSFSLTSRGISLIGGECFLWGTACQPDAGPRGRGRAGWLMGLRQEPADLTSLSQTYMSKQ